MIWVDWNHTQTFHTSTPEPIPLGAFYAYGVYTTFRLPITDYWLQAHLHRLIEQAVTLGLAIPTPLQQPALYFIEWLKLHYRTDTPIFRLSVLADVSMYGDFFQPGELPSRLLLSLRSSPPRSNTHLHLQSVRFDKPFPTLKLVGQAENIQMKRQAQAMGMHDILGVNSDGHITESSTANILFIRQGKIFTPSPTKVGCLPGITRLQAIESSASLGISVHPDALIPLSAIQQMDGALLSNAANGLQAIGQIDATVLPWPPEAQQLANRIHTQMQKEGADFTAPFPLITP